MLFLAVFCGFLAEYQLEHKIEKDREKQFIHSMVQDLASDTLAIDKVIEQNMRQIRGKDSFILMLNKTTWSKAEVAALYDMHWNYVGYSFNVPFAKRTINQLMNSGGLRIIRKKAASDSITLYAAQLEYIENTGQVSAMRVSDETLKASAPIFDTRFLRFRPDLSMQRENSGEPVLLSQNRENINFFTFMLEMDKDWTIGVTISLKKQREFAQALIQLLKREYHIQ